MEETKKFWGPEEVLTITDTEKTTHRGVPIVEVTTRRQDTDDKTRTRTTTATCFNLVTTEEPRDWNYVQDVKIDQMVTDIMNVVTDGGLDGSEMQPLVNKLSMALGNRLDHAAHIRFEGDDSEFVPGGNVYGDWSLAKAENIIVNSNVTDESSE